MLALILVATALGLSNFAAAIGIGLSGVDTRVRLRVAIVFGTFEAAMPLPGLDNEALSSHHYRSSATRRSGFGSSASDR